jgi:PleD family two-component response regulator
MELAQLLERLRVAVGSSPLTAGGAAVVVTVSAGAAVSGGEPADALIARADEAMYEAKARGRDRVVLAGQPPAS